MERPGRALAVFADRIGPQSLCLKTGEDLATNPGRRVSLSAGTPGHRSATWIGLAGVGSFGLTLCWASPAFGHALRQRYNLPIPLGLYLAGAGAAVALSFGVMVLFTRKPLRRDSYPYVNLLRFRAFRMLAHPSVLFLCRLLSVGVFALVVMAGVFGNQNTFKNFAPTAVWVVWWVGLAYICALVGDVWALINPWEIVFRWADGLYRHVRSGNQLALEVPYPEWLGTWPAVVLFLILGWAELIWEGAEIPASLADMVVVYSCITWCGMLLFGRERWLQGGEVFSVFFGTLARFAPTEFRSGDPDREWVVRPYGVGLLTAEPIHPSHMVFVVLMLSTVTFDGFIETPVWMMIVDGVLSAPLLYPALTVLHKMLGNLLPVITAAALGVFPLLFMTIYLTCVWLVGIVVAARTPGDTSQRHFSTTDLARRFVLTLVPIAIAYHLAHYLSYLLVAGQFIIPLASDPFGLGWDLLGTALYRINIGIVDARFVWYTAVIAIVIGHIMSVCLAHLMALRVFKDAGLATRSQYPMVGLMVSYTMISLWILAQPIVKTGGG